MRIIYIKERIKQNFFSNLINIFLIILLFFIINDLKNSFGYIKIPLWLLSIFLVGGFSLIKFIIFSIRRFYSVDIFFLRLYLFILPYTWFKCLILATKFDLVSHKKLNNSKFHEINAKKHEYMPFIIRLITKDSFLLEQLPPIAQKYFLYCKNKQYSFEALQKVYGYYRDPTIELAYRFGKGEKLEEFERERLIYESHLQERLLIENNLPRSNPILQEINKRQKIQLDNGFSIIK